MNFFESVQLKTAEREVKISKDKIKANVIWFEKNYEILKEWLRKKISASSSFYLLKNY